MQAFFHIFAKKSFSFFFGLLTGERRAVNLGKISSTQILGSSTDRMVKG
jgi:hypothetical protein